MSTDDLQTIDMMRKQGGNFVYSLALLFINADDENKARLKAAFPEVFAKYADIARRREAV